MCYYVATLTSFKFFLREFLVFGRLDIQHCLVSGQFQDYQSTEEDKLGRLAMR